VIACIRCRQDFDARRLDPQAGLGNSSFALRILRTSASLYWEQLAITRSPWAREQ
jgi:hypothetical protein